MITRKVAPALAAGCTVVLKPANETPLTALALAELAERAGIPKGVFNVLTGDSSAIGKVMTAHPAVRFVGFTGSTEVGKMLDEQAAVDGEEARPRARRQCAVHRLRRRRCRRGGGGRDDLEIPQHGPDLRLRQPHLCAGQDLRRVRREAATEVAEMKVGNGTEDGVTQGPLINMEAVDKVEEHIADAREARREGRDRRQAPCARRHLLRADRAVRRRRPIAGRAGGDVRPARAGVPLQGRGGRDPHGQQHRSSASRPISTPATSAASGASPRRSSPAWSASTPG